MPDLEKLQRDKDKILSLIKINGPCLPIKIAKNLGADLIFASALLAELKAEKKIFMSNMRVGSSPLYYLEGQKHMLENFIHFLNPKEKEAFEYLKQLKILQDSELEPAIRVALRTIKDFAIPLRVRVEGDVKLFWRYHLLSEKEIKDILQNILRKKSSPIQNEKRLESEKKTENIIPSFKKNEESIKEKNMKKENKKEIPEFPQIVRKFLEAKNVKFLETLSEKKKEFMAKIKIDMLFGEQKFLLIAKDKKKITDNDLTILRQKSLDEKMIGLFVSSGELNKKAKDYIKKWSGLIKYEKMIKNP